MTLTAIATCSACTWTETGDPKAVDKQADAHTRKQTHATVVRAEPSIPTGGRHER